SADPGRTRQDLPGEAGRQPPLRRRRGSLAQPPRIDEAGADRGQEPRSRHALEHQGRVSKAVDSTRRTLLTTAAAATAAAASRAFAQQPGGGAVMPVYQKGAVRIHFEEAGSGFPLLIIPGGGLNATI